MRYIVMLLLVLGAATVQADVWKWVDAHGNVHFVDTMKPIFTWVDEQGQVHYSDAPDHEDAVAVQLVWVSSGSLADVQQAASGDESGSGEAIPGETPEQRVPQQRRRREHDRRHARSKRQGLPQFGRAFMRH